jgi:hypothetical protein
MRRSRVVLASTYGARLDAADQLRAAGPPAGGDAEALRSSATDIDAASARFSDAEIAVTYAAFAELLRITAFTVEWRAAIRTAEADADRYLRAAKLRLETWLGEYGARHEAVMFLPAADALSAMDQASAVGAVCEQLAALPLPVGIDGDEHHTLRVPGGDKAATDREPPFADLTVAFLGFAVDGTAAANLNFLTPNETHDLEIEVRVSRWPEGAAALRLSPVSVEAASVYDLPTFEFSRSTGDAPYVFRQRGRAVIRGGQALRAQPFEFRYAAEFTPRAVEQPVAVVGHRTLRLESIDVSRSPFTGDAAVDLRLIELRNSLRETSPIPQVDLESAMSLVIGLSRLAVRSVADNIFPSAIPESQFQTETRDELRRDPVVGPRLTVHAHAAAGIADLSLSGVPLELKVNHARPTSVADAQGFVEQTAAYAVGAGKRVGVLGVLNAPARTAAAQPASDGLGILFAQSGLPILTVVIQGALPRPSDLSR